MVEKIIIAGAGGQGIMLLGKVLAVAGMRKNKNVTWLPSYGAEVRGGTAHCMVTISDEEIASPYIQQADTLIIMNEPSLTRFKERIKNKGLLILNSSLASSNKKIDKSCGGMLKFPFTDIAVKLGNIKVANMVAIGSYLGKNKTIDVKTVLNVIEDMAPEDKKGLLGINKQALFTGMELIK